jgi:RimJ/RimL family protein N-acetyltransferase
MLRRKCLCNLIMNFVLQPSHLKNDLIKLVPLKITDFDELYLVASDPLIWEQHPNKDRYKKEVFETFFIGALKSVGAFLVYDAVSGALIGSSRFYDFDEDGPYIAIGYTFLARSHWGTSYNLALKTLMLDYAFEVVNDVIFHVGKENIRSQKAVEKLGAKKIDKEEVAYYSGLTKTDYVYRLRKQDWQPVQKWTRSKKL